MSTQNQAHDITRIPRAVLSAAVGMVHTVERAAGGRPHTARDNAWEAVSADRARADERASLRRRIEALRPAPTVALSQSAVGSSPRSKASQTLVSAGRVAARS
ncbi:MAG TPA: hypothetical protein VGJ63_12980 [Micromonosporaceae bacterium]|jgi:hypothetical protein